MGILKINEINKSAILRNISIEIDNGIYGLLGPNGSGKTTLMRILATLLKNDSGFISYNNIFWSKDTEIARRLIGYLPQHFGCFRNISGYEFLDYIASLKGISAQMKRNNEIERVLFEVDLFDKRSMKVSKYSGGMLRRLGLAQAFLGDPKIILLDEPTAGLDPTERFRFRNFIQNMASDRIILLSTHILSDVEMICNNIALMRRGELTNIGRLENLINLAVRKTWIIETSNNKTHTFNNGIITSSKSIGDVFQIRILSDEQPSDEAKLVTPTIEEGYLVWNK